MRRGTQWGLDDRGADWRDRARCRDKDPELFFPIIGPRDGLTAKAVHRALADQIADAKAVCARCPVEPECLEAGLAERDGIWGGTTPEERAVVRNTRPPLRCEYCNAEIPLVPGGRERDYCSQAHRQAAYARRKRLAGRPT